MNDQISRQKLIEALEEVERRFPYKVAGKPDTYSEFNMAWESCMDCVFGAVESQPPADQWIPCSKQEYPTEDGWYWITGKHDGWEEPETRLLVYAAHVCGEFEWLKKQFELYNVTAWMPANLPEPYKGEQHEHD